MATIIRIKRSDVSGNPSVLATGELAYSNLTDNGSNGGDRLYLGMGTETAGNAASHLVIGGKYFVDQINNATDAATANTLVRRDASGNAAFATITATLSGNASTATKLQTSRTIALTGDVVGSVGFDGSGNVNIATTIQADSVALGTDTTGNYIATIAGTANEITVSGSGSENAAATLSLAPLAVSPAGTYGSSTLVPTIVVDNKGRVTSVSTNTAQVSWTIAGGTGSDVITSGETLTYTGGSGISTTVGANSLTITNTGVLQLTGTANQVTVSAATGNITLSLPQNIHTGASPTFAALTVTGASGINMSSQRIVSLADPVNPQDAATKAYVDASRAGLDVKDSVRAATTANITLNNTQTVDGVSLAANDRVLVKDQTDQTQNGIYVVVSGGAWTRSTDANTAAEVTPGMFTFVEEGTVNGDSAWVLTNNGSIILGTTSLTFAQFSGAGQIIAGAGITKTGNQLDIGAGLGITVNADDVALASTVAGNGLTYTSGVLDVVGTTARISVGANSIDIDSGYVGQSSITTLGTITTGVWNGTIVSGQFGGTGVNNSGKTITLGGNLTTSGAFATTFTVTGTTSVTLPTSGTLVNTAVTTLSSLASVGTITTGTWSATAIAANKGGTGQTTYAIGDILVASSSSALSKLAVGTAGQVLQSNGTTVVYGDVDGGTY